MVHVPCNDRLNCRRLFAIRDRATTVILEAIHAALRVFLHVRALGRIAVVVCVLLTLAVARAVVRGVLLVVDAIRTGRGFVMSGIALARQLLVLCEQRQAVRTDLLDLRKLTRRDGASTQNEEQCDPRAFHHWLAAAAG